MAMRLDLMVGTDRYFDHLHFKTCIHVLALEAGRRWNRTRLTEKAAVSELRSRKLPTMNNLKTYIILKKRVANLPALILCLAISFQVFVTPTVCIALLTVRLEESQPRDCPSSKENACSTIQAIIISLEPSQRNSAAIPAMATNSKDPITCHVLDTITGRPAATMSVTLRCCADPDIVFHCKTDADGRISNWQNDQGRESAESSFIESQGSVTAALHYMIRKYATETESSSFPAGSSLWKLQFDTGNHYGAKNTFFPVVELSFLVKEGEHFHVPLLLGPYSFTTYRGS